MLDYVANDNIKCVHVKQTDANKQMHERLCIPGRAAMYCLSVRSHVPRPHCLPAESTE